MIELLLSTIAILLAALVGVLAFMGVKFYDMADIHLGRIDLNDKRDDIQDVILSTILKDAFNSAGIAQGKSDWPHIFDRES